MRANRWPAAVAVVMLLSGCAGPGSPAAEQERVTVVVTATAATPRDGDATCARSAVPMPAGSLPASLGADEAREQARRALMEQRRQIPRRGAVPEAAVPGAEACVHALEIHFSLLMRGSREAPGEPEIDAALRSAGLTEIVVSPRPSFAGSTGAACVYGSFTAAGPEFVIGPAAPGRPCP